jgi:hypothetical protein
MKFRKRSVLVFAISMGLATGAMSPTRASAQIEELIEPLIEGLGDAAGAVGDMAGDVAPYAWDFSKDVAKAYVVRKTVDFVDRRLSGTATQNGSPSWGGSAAPPQGAWGWSTAPSQGTWAWSLGPAQQYRGYSNAPAQGSWNRSAAPAQRSSAWSPPPQGSRGWQGVARPSRPYWETAEVIPYYADQGRQPRGRPAAPSRAGWGRGQEWSTSAQRAPSAYDAEMVRLKADNERLQRQADELDRRVRELEAERKARESRSLGEQGMNALRSHKYHTAELLFRSGMRSDPKEVGHHYGLAMALLGQLRSSEADTELAGAVTFERGHRHPAQWYTRQMETFPLDQKAWVGVARLDQTSGVYVNEPSINSSSTTRVANSRIAREGY